MTGQVTRMQQEEEEANSIGFDFFYMSSSGDEYGWGCRYCGRDSQWPRKHMHSCLAAMKHGFPRDDKD